MDRLSVAFGEISAALEDQKRLREDAEKREAELEVQLEAEREQHRQREATLLNANQSLMFRVEDLTRQVTNLQEQVMVLMREQNAQHLATAGATSAGTPDNRSVSRPRRAQTIDFAATSRSIVGSSPAGSVSSMQLMSSSSFVPHGSGGGGAGVAVPASTRRGAAAAAAESLNDSGVALPPTVEAELDNFKGRLQSRLRVGGPTSAAAAAASSLAGDPPRAALGAATHVARGVLAHVDDDARLASNGAEADSINVAAKAAVRRHVHLLASVSPVGAGGYDQSAASSPSGALAGIDRAIASTVGQAQGGSNSRAAASQLDFPSSAAPSADYRMRVSPMPGQQHQHDNDHAHDDDKDADGLIDHEDQDQSHQNGNGSGINGMTNVMRSASVGRHTAIADRSMSAAELADNGAAHRDNDEKRASEGGGGRAGRGGAGLSLTMKTGAAGTSSAAAAKASVPPLSRATAAVSVKTTNSYAAAMSSKGGKPAAGGGDLGSASHAAASRSASAVRTTNGSNQQQAQQQGQAPSWQGSPLAARGGGAYNGGPGASAGANGNAGAASSSAAAAVADIPPSRPEVRAAPYDYQPGNNSSSNADNAGGNNAARQQQTNAAASGRGRAGSTAAEQQAGGADPRAVSAFKSRPSAAPAAATKAVAAAAPSTARSSSSAASGATATSAPGPQQQQQQQQPMMSHTQFFALLRSQVLPSNLETLMAALAVFNKGSISKQDLLAIAERSLTPDPTLLAQSKQQAADLLGTFKALILRV